MNKIQLPGKGFSLWLPSQGGGAAGAKLSNIVPDSLKPTNLKAASTARVGKSGGSPPNPGKSAGKSISGAPSEGAKAEAVRLPGEGHSIWTQTKPAKAVTGVQLPGAGFSLWTKATAAGAAKVPGTALESEDLSAASSQPARPKVDFIDEDAPASTGGWLRFFPYALLLLLAALALLGFMSKHRAVEKHKEELGFKNEAIKTLQGTKMLLTDENRELTSNLADTRNHASDLSGQLTVANQEIESQTASIADLTGRIAETKQSYEAKVTELRGQVDQLTKTSADLDKKLKTSDSTADSLKEDKVRLENDLADLKSSLDSALRLAKEREDQLKLQLEGASELEGVKKSLEAQLANAEAAIQAAEKQNKDLAAKVSEFQTALSGAKSEFDSKEAAYEDKIASLTALSDRLLGNLKDKETALKSAGTELEKARALTDQMKNQETQLNDELAALRREADALRAKVATDTGGTAEPADTGKVRTFLAEIRAKVAELENEIARSEGESEQ